MLGGTVAGENIDEFAFSLGDNSLVLLLGNLQHEKKGNTEHVELRYQARGVHERPRPRLPATEIMLS